MNRFLIVLLTLGLLATPLVALAADRPGAVLEGTVAAAESKDPSPIPGVSQALIPALTTLVVFLVLLVVLGTKAWGPIVKGLQAREDKIRNDIETAEKSRIAAEMRLKEYEARLAGAESQVRELLNKAQSDAEKIATSVKMRAQEEAEAIKERANKEIDAARKAAIAEVYEQAATISTTIAGKILQRNINADDQRELVRSSLDQLASTRN